MQVNTRWLDNICADQLNTVGRFSQIIVPCSSQLLVYIVVYGDLLGREVRMLKWYTVAAYSAGEGRRL